MRQQGHAGLKIVVAAVVLGIICLSAAWGPFTVQVYGRFKQPVCAIHAEKWKWTHNIHPGI